MALPNLSSTQLQAKAAELDRMAGGARTADTRDALRRLATRFAQLAEARMIDEGGDAATIGLRSPLPAPDKTNSADG